MAEQEALGAFYRLDKPIGRGASGQVWLAHDVRTSKSVAAKVLRAEHTDDPALVSRFVSERSILVGLRHPAIVSVRDLIVDGGRMAIVMDYVDGGSVRTLLATDLTLPPAVPASLWHIVAAMLDKDPANRPTAQQAAKLIRQASPQWADLAALPPTQPTEGQFAAPVPTMVKGQTSAHSLTQLKASAMFDDAGASESVPIAPASPPPDLGTAPNQTRLRPMHLDADSSKTEPSGTDQAGVQDVPWWRRHWRWLALGGVALVVVIAIVVRLAMVAHHGRPVAKTPSPTPPAPQIQAMVTDQPLPAGLTISRIAVYEPTTHQVHLTITYAAQNAALKGPFFQIIPGLTSSAACPTVTWTPAVAQVNLPTATGVTSHCGWSITPATIPAQGSQQINATIELHLTAATNQTQLQKWLQTASEKTHAALADPNLTGTVYPVQRLQSIAVQAPPRIVSNETLPLTLFPVWASGRDTTNPLYKSPAVGQPSSMLQAIAGGEHGVRFSDGCGGALKVSQDGLVVTALSMASHCTVQARVGNFATLTSNQFDVVARGG